MRALAWACAYGCIMRISGIDLRGALVILIFKWSLFSVYRNSILWNTEVKLVLEEFVMGDKSSKTKKEKKKSEKKVNAPQP